MTDDEPETTEAVSVQLLVAPWDLARVRDALETAGFQLLEVPSPNPFLPIHMVAPRGRESDA